MAHSSRSLGTPKSGTLTQNSSALVGGVQLGGHGPATGKLKGDGQANAAADTPGAKTASGPAIRSTPGRTVAGTNKKIPS